MTPALSDQVPLNTPRVRFHSSKGATLLDVRRAMQCLRNRLIAAKVSQIEISSAEIVLAEVLNNIVKHAHQGVENGWFDIHCYLPVSGGLFFTCRDNGTAMPGGAPPGGVMPSIARAGAELPEGGWGWALIRRLTTDLDYMRIDGINLVNFTIPKSPPPSH